MKSKPREFFNTFRPFLNNKTKGTNSICLKSEKDETIIEDQKQVAETLADYFSTAAVDIGGDYVNNLTEKDLDNHSSVQMIRKSHVKPNFNFRHIDKSEVQDSLEKIDARKSCGWDVGLPPKLLKEVAVGIAPSLTNLYNECVETGYWFRAWKKGELTPVPKKGDKQDIQNYRPITTLITIDKVFELLLCKQITEHYDSTLSQRLTAYRKNHSCQTTLIRLVEDWKYAIDRKELVAVLSTDMSKAFDSLCHNLVIKKLDAYGFGSGSLDLIRSFLNERYNRVNLNSVSSEWKSMPRGCPQGSSFGPLLWNLFQNDMSFLVKESNLTMYADDHQLYSTGTKCDTVMSNLSAQGKLAMTWYRDNFLLANSDKFQCLSINPRNIDRENQNTTLYIGNDGITSTPFIKLLGVEIDGDLDFTSHISNICTRTSQKVGVLMRLRNLIPTKAKLIIYKTSILPHLTYCHLAWHFCRASDSRKIERIQERALRAVFKSFSEPYEELLKKAKLSSLLNRRLVVYESGF